MGVGGSRAYFAALLVDFGARSTYGPLKMSENEWDMTENHIKSLKNHDFRLFSGSSRSLSAFGAKLPRFGWELAALRSILLHFF